MLLSAIRLLALSLLALSLSNGSKECLLPIIASAICAASHTAPQLGRPYRLR